MIEKIILKKHDIESSLILEFLNTHDNYDFYFTESNIRYYVTDKYTLKKLLKGSTVAYCSKNKGDYKGLGLIWKGVGEDKVRYYVKLSAINHQTAKDLITVLLWNSNKELFVKIRKDSKFIDAFKQKGFKFIASRGIQILLNRKYVPHEAKVFHKNED